MDKRVEGGKPVRGTNVVAVDAISYLSGVNFGSVIKVLAAIAAIDETMYRTTGDTEIILDIISGKGAPIAPLSPGKPGMQTRVKETDKFVRTLIREGYANESVITLKLADRFPREAEDGKRVSASA